MREFSDFEQKIIVAGLSYFGAISSVFLGSWITNFRANSAIRKDHRRVIRAIRSAFTSGAKYPFSCCGKIDEWWITAIEDYGFFRRWKIPRLMKSMRTIEFPEPEWDRNLEGSGTPEQYERYNKKHADAAKRFMAIFDKIIFWA